MDHDREKEIFTKINNNVTESSELLSKYESFTKNAAGEFRNLEDVLMDMSGIWDSLKWYQKLWLKFVSACKRIKHT